MAPPVLTGATVTSAREEKDLADIDMKLDDEDQPAADFHRDDTAMPNIWSINDEDEDSSHKSGDNTTDRDDRHHDQDSHADHDIVASSLDDDLEKPSFLRRLSRRHKPEDDDSTTETDDK